MQPELIFDAHLDLAWNAIQWNRDITQSIYTIRTQETNIPGKGRAVNTVALPDMREANIKLCFATLMGRNTGGAVPHLDFLSPMQTYGVAQGHLAYYRALEHRGHVRIITDLDGLTQHLSAIETDDPTLGFIISMESADAILDPEQLGAWYDAGVRLIGPAHYGMGRYAGGTGVEDGFTDIGFELLQQMEQQNIVLDMTHLSDKAFWQALEKFDGHIIASHNNCRALVPHQRQFSDAQLNAIIERGAVIGMAFDTWMLEEGWIKGVTTNDNITLATVVDHIDHICQLAGNTNHVGIGSDLDGGFGREQSPSDLNTIADLHHMKPILSERGYSDKDITKIFSGNWIRKINEAWTQ